MVEIIPEVLRPELLEGLLPIFKQLLRAAVPAVVKLYSPALREASPNTHCPVPPLVAMHPMILRALEQSWQYLELHHSAAEMWESWELDVHIRDTLCKKLAKLDDRDPRHALRKREILEVVHGLDYHTERVTLRTIEAALCWRTVL